MLFFTLIISAVIATPTTHRDNAVSLLEKKDAIASPDPGPAKPGAFRPPDPYEREHAGSKFTAKNFGTQWTPWSEVNKLVIDMTFNVLTNVSKFICISYGIIEQEHWPTSPSNIHGCLSFASQRARSVKLWHALSLTLDIEGYRHTWYTICLADHLHIPDYGGKQAIGPNQSRSTTF